jgi:hypothetical protein
MISRFDRNWHLGFDCAGTETTMMQRETPLGERRWVRWLKHIPIITLKFNSPNHHHELLAIVLDRGVLLSETVFVSSWIDGWHSAFHCFGRMSLDARLDQGGAL